jgi:hypothetical protein
MLGIPREVAEHELRIKLGSKPVQQHLRHFDDERCRAIGEEIAKLLAAGFIKEVYHSDWLANPVLLKKKRRMGNGECVLTILALTRCVPRTLFLCRA